MREELWVDLINLVSLKKIQMHARIKIEAIKRGISSIATKEIVVSLSYGAVDWVWRLSRLW